jgi:RNA polymerase sigma-70 factor (ECF subfamily)
MPADQESVLMSLLTRARAGDAAARDELFARCRNYVGLIARAQVESWMQAKVDASDLVQQTLLEAHRGLARFQGRTEAEWLAWLKQILTHNAQDFIRQYRTDKRHAGREVPLHAPVDTGSGSFFRDPPDDGDSPSQFLVQQEREIELADAIARLSADHQEVIMLRNLQRLPFDQVAARMGRSRPAVQMLWMRAVQKLEELLRESSACP